VDFVLLNPDFAPSEFTRDTSESILVDTATEAHFAAGNQLGERVRDLYLGAGDYRGLFKHVDITDAVSVLEGAVEHWRAATRLGHPWQTHRAIALGHHSGWIPRMLMKR